MHDRPLSVKRPAIVTVRDIGVVPAGGTDVERGVGAGPGVLRGGGEAGAGGAESCAEAGGARSPAGGRGRGGDPRGAGARRRGRRASRNALFADVMGRTGLRLAEQAS